VADKNWVSEILKAWKAVPDADVIGGQVRARNIANQTAHFLFLVYYEPIEKNAIIGTNMTFKKERLLEVGAFGDPFACRGDETFLFYKMGSDHKEVKWSQAIVFHDWPVSIRQWLKERISNGEMHRLITRILEDRKSLFKVFLFKRLSIIAIAIFLGALLPPKFMWGIIFVLFVFLLRGIRHGTFKMCKDNYPFIAVLFLPLLWQVLNEIGEWLFHIGRWRGYRIPFDKSCALKGTLEDKNIIQVVVNH
jgi:GT2 family glycosyltransferase